MQKQDLFCIQERIARSGKLAVRMTKCACLGMAFAILPAVTWPNSSLYAQVSSDPACYTAPPPVSTAPTVTTVVIAPDEEEREIPLILWRAQDSEGNSDTWRFNPEHPDVACFPSGDEGGGGGDVCSYIGTENGWWRSGDEGSSGGSSPQPPPPPVEEPPPPVDLDACVHFGHCS
jgi:hypothetical protein